MSKVLKSLLSVMFGMSLAAQSFAMEPMDPTFAMDPKVTLPAGSHLQELATITNSRDASTAVLSVLFSAKNEVLGIYTVYTIDDDERTVETDILPIDQIESPEGAVLHEEKGLKIFILQGRIDAAHGTAALQVRYLTNGLKLSYESCKLNAQRSYDGRWALINAYNGSVVTQARARTWALGVRTIENICP
jgi:hypothetical protein